VIRATAITLAPQFPPTYFTMSPASLPDNPSPKSSVPPAVIQATKDEIPDSQQTSPGVSPGPVRRPSFEKVYMAQNNIENLSILTLSQLDSDEVAKAMGIAAALSKMKPYSPKQKKTTPKPPPPKPAEFIPRPPPVPFSGNSNPDAIALRSSASLLQMQAAKARQDLETLERLKALASEDPLAFTKELVTGRVKQEPSSGGVLGATLAPLESLLKNVDPEDVKATEEDAAKEIPDTQESEDNDITSASSPLGPSLNSASKFPPIPAPQNIIRMPPINWSKYGVVGDSLDKLHEEQRTNPSPSQPEILTTRDSQPSRPVLDQYQHSTEKAAPYVVAAPYDPLKDQPSSSAKAADSRRGFKKTF
jgi:hypothetical protein